MKKREQLQDEFLSGLMNRASMEAPSEDFTGNVMRQVETMPAYRPQGKPFFLYLRTALPWVLLAVAFVLFYIVADFPIGKYITGNEYVKNMVLPSTTSLFTFFKDLASYRFYSLALVVLICAGGLFMLDRMITRRLPANHHYLI